jgi:hypothetical protein
MAYVVPNAAAFKLRFPTFAAVADATITAALAEGAGRVDSTWREADYAPAIMLYAAHVLVMDGHGASNEVMLAGFKRVKVGSLELERSDGRSASAGTLGSTSYGTRFTELVRLNFSGPLVV